MGNKTQEKLIREMHSLQCYLQDHAIFISNIIKKYGDASVIRKTRRNQEVDLGDYVHDYVFFCYTKGARSLLAADTLLTEGFFEDAKVVLRSAYECYLNASFIIRNPDNIVQLIILKVGEYSGRYAHPVDKKGKKIRKKIINPTTNELIDFDVSVAKMASNTAKESDSKVHPELYSFLSEFSHVHMIASGSYRDKTEEWYSVKPDSSSAYYSIVLSTYISWLLFDSALNYVTSKGKVQKTLHQQNQKSIRLLIRRFREINFSEKLMPMQEAIINRLKSSQI